MYYNKDFTEKTMEVEVCTQIEKGLQKLQNQYSEKEAQRKLLLLLAANAELMKEWEKQQYTMNSYFCMIHSIGSLCKIWVIFDTQRAGKRKQETVGCVGEKSWG